MPPSALRARSSTAGSRGTLRAPSRCWGVSQLIPCRFAIDGRFHSWLDIPVLGFGPGEERFTHTHQDHVKVADFLDAVKAYARLACRVCGVE